MHPGCDWCSGVWVSATFGRAADDRDGMLAVYIGKYSASIVSVIKAGAEFFSA